MAVDVLGLDGGGGHLRVDLSGQGAYEVAFSLDGPARSALSDGELAEGVCLVRPLA